MAVKKLLEDISISELMQMREQGMTNKEIAEAVGVCTNTIKSKIGSMPPEMIAKVRREGLQKARAKKLDGKHNTPSKKRPATHLVVQNRLIELHGKAGSYNIDCKQGHLLMSIDDNQSMLIKLDELDDFVAELQAIQQKMKELTVTNEAW